MTWSLSLRSLSFGEIQKVTVKDKCLIHGVMEIALKSDLNSNPNFAIYWLYVFSQAIYFPEPWFLSLLKKMGIISITFVERNKRYSVQKW